MWETILRCTKIRVLKLHELVNSLGNFYGGGRDCLRNKDRFINSNFSVVEPPTDYTNGVWVYFIKCIL